MSLRQLIGRTGHFFGSGLDMGVGVPSIEGSLRTLHRLGFRPAFCIDVGAYQGEWTTLFRSIFLHSKVLMVEAQEAQRPVLQQVRSHHPDEISMAISLLGSADGHRVAFSEMATGSSVFPESSPYLRSTVTKTTQRLDSLLLAGRYPSVDFLKLDVQGYELEVLKGAPAALSQSTAVLLEASLMPVNRGCPLVAEIIAFMAHSRFRLFDFCSQIRRRDGVLWQTDLLFLREASSFLPEPALTHDNWH